MPHLSAPKSITLLNLNIKLIFNYKNIGVYPRGLNKEMVLKFTEILDNRTSLECRSGSK